ncbi:restriction endonuclease subunit S [Halomonas sp. TRM85114]|uniref:restriction endonuclease subunit S n=1 Tax=Halomonas jincaotanensis TaxID=2810616 RepID=UPI001BD27694|nr:restriction endonuclease subunit S [Halomonas jincaotanensis]MBS9404797.1 restriction endonuclease subunit S [Halomonas jincaotanensis]
MINTGLHDWKQLILEDLGRVVTGRTPPSSKPELFGDHYPFITPTDMTFSNRSIWPERGISEEGAESLSRIKLPAKTPCFVCIGATIGKLCLTSVESFTNQQINSIVVDKEKHCPEFVYYLLRHISAGVKSLAGGAATPIINKTSFSQVPVLVPHLQIQESIAAILSAYDDLVENNTRRIEILEEMARRLYEEWFVLFRFPGHEKTGFKESELGRIPKEWECGSLKDCIELAYGKALKKSDRKSGPYPVYGSSGEVGTHCKALVKGPGIILGRKGNVGSLFWTEDDFYPIDTVYYLKTDLPLEYAFFNLKRQRFLNNDAAVPGLNRNQAYSLPFLKPSDEVLQDFSSHCKPIYELIRKLHRKNSNLRAQRDLLLPKLVSGEIDVPEISKPYDKEVKAA